MATFKEYIAPHFADVYEFVFLRSEVISERQTVLEPVKFCHIPVAQLLNQQIKSEPAISFTNLTKKDDFLSGAGSIEASF